ncbi:MAG: ABC transporter ATP-binding protein [Eubacteriales bacterium]|nr:ABC transporter ATP-binding protein [Eubacteriales bacterium]
MATLEASALVAGYDHNIIVNQVSLTLPKGKISVIIGGNGCGKSTMLKTFARLLSPSDGQVLLDGKEINSQPSKSVAQRLGLLPQSPIVPDGIRVTDLVSRGRFPYRQFARNMSREDFRAVQEAMEIMGITELADRCVDELSGGQRQRVWIALALAQETDILLLDEPITYLDIAYQVEILDLLTDLNRKKGTTICMVLHDINLSARYADYIFAMKKGTLIAEGTPQDVICPALLHEVFGIRSTVLTDPVSQTPLIVPIGRHHAENALA